MMFAIGRNVVVGGTSGVDLSRETHSARCGVAVNSLGNACWNEKKEYTVVEIWCRHWGSNL